MMLSYPEEILCTLYEKEGVLVHEFIWTSYPCILLGTNKYL